MWDNGEEAITKVEIVIKKENNEFTSDEARVSEFSNTCWWWKSPFIFSMYPFIN